jgi:hypothetical protein
MKCVPNSNNASYLYLYPAGGDEPAGSGTAELVSWLISLFPQNWLKDLDRCSLTPLVKITSNELWLIGDVHQACVMLTINGL